MLADYDYPVPQYGFIVLMPKATELCAAVKALGSALLSALEKRDAEDSTLLRQRHEFNLLKRGRSIVL